MLFEGYYQYLCKKGHETTRDVGYCYGEELCKCPICGEKIVWSNLVDVTNGSYEGSIRIDGYVALEEKERKICEHCKTVLEITYKIPKTKRKK
jgi:hypothetical protein